MSRPRCCRRIAAKPGANLFKPVGVPAKEIEELVMTLDEFEALRLADAEGLYQQEAAVRMDVSRPTFGRVLDGARKKVARALVEGLALRIQGGPVRRVAGVCPRCRREWACQEERTRPGGCPACQPKPGLEAQKSRGRPHEKESR